MEMKKVRAFVEVGALAGPMADLADDMVKRVEALKIRHTQQSQFMALRHMQEQRELGGYAEAPYASSP